MPILQASNGEVVQKFKPAPEQKPPRRNSPIQNKTDRDDYMKNYMDGYRKDQGKDYQKVPDNIKEFRKKQRKRLKKKFNLKKVAENFLNNLLIQ
jgi:hypothetical protein